MKPDMRVAVAEEETADTRPPKLGKERKKEKKLPPSASCTLHCPVPDRLKMQFLRSLFDSWHGASTDASGRVTPALPRSLSLSLSIGRPRRHRRLQEVLD